MSKEYKKWKCNICGVVFPTDGTIEDEAHIHTLEAHLDYTILNNTDEGQYGL